MSQTQVFLDAIINNLPMMVTVVDANTQKFVLANKATEKVFGTPSAIIGKTLHDLLPRDRADEFALRDLAVIKSGKAVTFECEYESDTKLSLFATLIPLFDEKRNPQYLLSIYEDVTEKRKAENDIIYLAHHDCLTGIGNRATFYSNLKESFAYYQHGGIFSLVYLDLDDFKSINDTLGHPVGDQVLVAVAERLRKIIREPHHIARLGGDEFAIIFNGVPSVEALHAAIDRIVSAIAAPIEICGSQVITTASIGVAIGPDDASDPDALLRNADIALYCAKKEGGNTQRYFDMQMLKDFHARHALENDLRHALENNELKLYYQPLVGLSDGRVNGFEALMRWDSPTRGLVSPVDFIPLAEETGLIRSIGAWALKRACLDAADWPEDVGVSVNISACQFRDQSILLDVAAALGASNLKPSRLELEITESVMLDNTEEAIAILEKLRHIGVKIAMDDFGTGYSSLAYLTKFAFDKVKIDRAFVNGVAENPDCLAIIRAITGLCESLNIPTTAEGVETEAQLQWLRTERCNSVQGYLLGRPKPVETVEEILAGHAAADGKRAAVA